MRTRQPFRLAFGKPPSRAVVPALLLFPRIWCASAREPCILLPQSCRRRSSDNRTASRAVETALGREISPQWEISKLANGQRHGVALTAFKLGNGALCALFPDRARALPREKSRRKKRSGCRKATARICALRRRGAGNLIEAARRGNYPAARRFFYFISQGACRFFDGTLLMPLCFFAERVINTPLCAYVERAREGQASSGGTRRHIRPKGAPLDKTPQILRAKI